MQAGVYYRHTEAHTPCGACYDFFALHSLPKQPVQRTVWGVGFVYTILAAVSQPSGYTLLSVRIVRYW